MEVCHCLSGADLWYRWQHSACLPAYLPVCLQGVKVWLQCTGKTNACVPVISIPLPVKHYDFPSVYTQFIMFVVWWSLVQIEWCGYFSVPHTLTQVNKGSCKKPSIRPTCGSPCFTITHTSIKLEPIMSCPVLITDPEAHLIQYTRYTPVSQSVTSYTPISQLTLFLPLQRTWSPSNTPPSSPRTRLCPPPSMPMPPTHSCLTRSCVTTWCWVTWCLDASTRTTWEPPPPSPPWPTPPSQSPSLQVCVGT